jgi:hypothetical protein
VFELGAVFYCCGAGTDPVDLDMQDKYYGDDNAIEQEVSLWSSLFGESDAKGGDDWSIDALTDGVASLGLQLIQGMDSMADAIGSLGDMIPDLIFGPEDEEYTKEELANLTKKDKHGQVVVGGNRARGVKKRGAGHNATEPSPGIAPLQNENELDDEESNDWTKED